MFCKDTGQCYCSLTGEMVFLDNTKAVENNCQTFNSHKWVDMCTTTIAVVSTITAIALIIYVVVLRRRIKENERHLATRSNKTENAEMPERERDSIKVEHACADEIEDIETCADVTILYNETVEMTRQKYNKEGAYNFRL